MGTKKGQLTIFIILLLVLLFAVGAYFLVRSGAQNSGGAQKTSDPVYVYAKECIENALFSSAKLFGYQQGYYIVPKTSLNTSFYRIAYYYLKGESFIPSNKIFEEEFSKIATYQIAEKCSDFSSFNEKGYSVKTESPIAKTKISANDLAVNVNYPIFIAAANSSYAVSEFDYEIPVRIGHVLDVSRAVVDEIKKEPYSIDMTFLLNHDVAISVQNYDSCNQVYLILDNESKMKDGEAYSHSFAVGFSDEYCIKEEILP